MNADISSPPPSDDQPHFAKRFIANLPWEKLVLWGIFGLFLWLMRNFLAVIFITFVLSYIAHYVIVKLLCYLPNTLVNNLWLRRGLVVAVFGLFITALYAASVLVFPAMIRQGDELLVTIQKVDPRQKISEAAITYLGEKKLEDFKHYQNDYQHALKAYAHDQAGEFAYTQFISALDTEEAFRQSIFEQGAKDVDMQLENAEFEEEAFLDYMVDSHFMAQSDWRERFEQDMLNKLSPQELANFRLQPEYAIELHDWLSAHLTAADLALYTEDPAEMSQFKKNLRDKMGLEKYSALHQSADYAKQVKIFFDKSDGSQTYPIFQNIASALNDFDRVAQQKFHYIDVEYFPYRDSDFYLDSLASWYANTKEGNATFANYWTTQVKQPAHAITDTEFQRERQNYIRQTYFPSLLRDNPLEYKKIRQQFEEVFLPNLSSYGYYFQLLSDAYRADFKKYYIAKHQSQSASADISHDIQSAFNHYLIQSFGEKQWSEITSSVQYKRVMENIQGFFTTHLGEITLMLGSAVKNTAAFFVQFFVSVIFSFIIVLDIPHLRAQFQSLRSTRLRQFYDTITPGLQTFGNVMGKAFAAQAVIAVCNTVFTYIGMRFLNIPLAELMSVFVFICSFIPVLGVFISSIPISLVALQTHGVILMLEAIALIAIIHALEAYLLNPKITGNFLKVHPLIVLMILFVGEHFFGIWGLLLGVPVCVYIFRYAILDLPFPRS